jgi:hypothetical protein
VTHLLPQAITQDFEGHKRLNLRLLDTLQMKQVGLQDPSVLGGSLRRERNIMSPDQRLRRPLGGDEGVRDISTAPAALRGAMGNRPSLGDSMTLRREGGGPGSRTQSKLLSPQQTMSPSFLSRQQIKDKDRELRKMDTERTLGGLAHLDFLGREGFGSEDEEEGEEGREPEGSNSNALNSTSGTNHLNSTSGRSNILYQTMFMNLPKIESPKVSRRAS